VISSRAPGGHESESGTDASTPLIFGPQLHPDATNTSTHHLARRITTSPIPAASHLSLAKSRRFGLIDSVPSSRE
jgi:hypothetical protein